MDRPGLVVSLATVVAQVPLVKARQALFEGGMGTEVVLFHEAADISPGLVHIAQLLVIEYDLGPDAGYLLQGSDKVPKVHR